MKRVDLTPEQLKDVIRLRQSGLSWHRIHEATNISPKVALRSYRGWEKARSIRELENVRVKVGEIEFERHLDMLTRLAQNLVDHLSIPDYPAFSSDAVTYFSFLMVKQIAEPPSDTVLVAGGEDKLRVRNTRRNTVLFESLKEHTADKFRWDSLNDWMEGWDTCHRVYPSLKTIAGETVRTTFSRFPDFEVWFATGKNQNKPFYILEEGTRDVLWQAIVAGQPNTAVNSIYSEKVRLTDKLEILHIYIGKRSLAQKDNMDLSPSVVDYCREVIGELWNTAEAREITGAVESMKAVVAELEAVLEPLVLRPIILHSRCKICPA